MNNNTKRRKAAWHKHMRKHGFPKPLYKAKKKPFPQPDKDIDLSLRTQREIFYGACFVA